MTFVGLFANSSAAPWEAHTVPRAAAVCGNGCWFFRQTLRVCCTRLFLQVLVEESLCCYRQGSQFPNQTPSVQPTHTIPSTSAISFL